jgi:hypothetical protein
MSGVTQKATIAKGQIFSNSLKNSLMLNLVSEWDFDGTTNDGNAATANDVLDTWSKVNNGSVVNPPTVKTGSNCVSGSCLQFDGNDDVISFGSNSSLSMGLGDQTISVWVRFDNATAPHDEVLAGCGGDYLVMGGYEIKRTTGGSSLMCLFSDGVLSSIAAVLAPTGSLVSNNWYNVVVVFNRSSVAQAYINGTKQEGYSLNISGQRGNVVNAKSLTIGAWASTSYPLVGRMDEVKLYNAAMPTSQIKELYYTGLNSLLINGGIDKKEYLSKLSELSINSLD